METRQVNDDKVISNNSNYVLHAPIILPHSNALLAREIKLKSKLSIPKIAKMARVSPRTFCRFMGGKSQPSSKNFSQLLGLYCYFYFLHQNLLESKQQDPAFA